MNHRQAGISELVSVRRGRRERKKLGGQGQIDRRQIKRKKKEKSKRREKGKKNWIDKQRERKKEGERERMNINKEKRQSSGCRRMQKRIL